MKFSLLSSCFVLLAAASPINIGASIDPSIVDISINLRRRSDHKHHAGKGAMKPADRALPRP